MVVEQIKTMKTTRNLLHSSVGIILSGLLVAAAFAGPPAYMWDPQFRKTPAAKSAPEPKAPAAPKCDGCKTTPVWMMGDRLPAGKGVGLHVVGKKHECTRCTGSVASENGKVKNTMAHNAVCAPLPCCK